MQKKTRNFFLELHYLEYEVNDFESFVENFIEGCYDSNIEYFTDDGPYRIEDGFLTNHYLTSTEELNKKYNFIKKN